MRDIIDASPRAAWLFSRVLLRSLLSKQNGAVLFWLEAPIYGPLAKRPLFRAIPKANFATKPKIQLVFITPGRPVENSYAESFNGRLRDEFLNVNLFFSLADVRQQLQSWQKDYNGNRPHSALADQTPNEFVASWNKVRFAFLTVNKPVQPACQGFPNGTPLPGLDRPPGLAEETNKKAKPACRIGPLARVT
jgi:Integrase core domain